MGVGSARLAPELRVPKPPTMTATQPWPADKRETFRALHEKTLVMPNPWDRGSTRILGFPALANTSAGFANSLGRHDGRTTRDEAIAHAGEILDAMESGD